MITRKSFIGMSNEEWLSQRRKTIGGSDAGSLLGLNPYTSPYALWAEKTGAIVPEDISDKESVRLGHDLEDYVAHRFSEETEKKVRRDNNFVYNSEYPFAHVQADRLIVGENAGLECKTTSSFEILKKCRDGEYPDTWYAQCIHGMMVTGADRWYLAVLVFGHGFFWFTIDRNQDEINALAAAEKDYWCLVETKTPPPVDGMDSTEQALKTIYRDSDGSKVDLLPLSVEISTYIAAKKQRDDLEKIIQEQQNRICSYMGAAEAGTCSNYKVSWKSQQRKTFDHKRFQNDNPNVPLDSYYNVSTARPFKITEVSKN